ncbi:MAG TPA: formyltransferase family protein [Flavobacteriales bacterium]|nr:formyltransferase family protein [Flavobacteriales bacterium]
MTHLGWDGKALCRSMMESGITPALIVCEARDDAPYYKWPSRMARRVVGNRIVDRLSRLRLPVDVIATMNWERTLYDEAQRWLRMAFDPKDEDPEWPSDVPRVVTHHINDERIVAKVREARPDLIMVFGTGMIKKPLLDLPVRGSINAHSSLLPHYKGPRSEFWQCFNDDPRHVGVTFHMMASKADAGDILFQVPTRTTWPSDPYRMRAANTLEVLRRYPQVVKDYLDGNLRPQPQGPSSTPVYKLKDQTLELRVALKKRIAG